MEKKVFRWYGAGAFQANAADLDARSAAGWNLKKPGSCRFTFERGEVRYRYGLDYCPGSFGEEERKARRQRYEAAQSDGERERCALAARYGIAALENREAWRP